MKRNLLKRVSLLSLASLALLSPTITKAENVCTTHKNYYLYLLIDEVPGFVNNVYNSNENHEKEYYNSAYFPMLPENAQAAFNNSSGIVYGRICLSKDGVADGKDLQCVKGITWTLEDYYRIRLDITNHPSRKTPITINNKEYTITEYEKEGELENGYKVIEHYYGGAKWYKCEDAACANATEGASGADTSKMSIENLVKGSYLPTQTGITFHPAESSRAIITRKINVKDFLDYLTYDENGNPKVDDEGSLIINNNSQKVTPFNLVWMNGQEARKSLLAPAVYYVEYQTCQDEYKATINYYYFKDGKTTTDKVEFDNKEDNPYTKTGLILGSKDSVKSPEKKGCTIVDTKGNKYDTDKVVSYEIKNEDFTKDVYYYCPAEDEAKTNSKTGDALIYLAWAIGLGAIGYSVYYFKKEKKEEI